MLLALETSSFRGSVALWREGRIVDSEQLPSDQRSGRSLVPTIARIVERAGETPRGIRQIAVTAGPGSFTGLRMGVVAAKTLAFAVGAPVLGVDTLDALVLTAFPEPVGTVRTVGRVHALLDAQRGQAFCRTYQAEQIGASSAEPARIVDWDAFAAGLSENDWIVGTVSSAWKQRLSERVAASHRREVEPDAVAVARLGAMGFAAGRFEDLASFAPRYVRLAAAEEKASAKNA